MVNRAVFFQLVLFFLFVLPVCIFARKPNSEKQTIGAEDASESKALQGIEGVYDTEGGGDDTEDEENIEETWQTLEWEASDSEFVLFYTVIIEKYNVKKQSFEKALEIRAENTDTSVEIRPRQSPGRYRYKIVAYNLIGATSTESEWMEFSIFPALLPRITNITSSATGSSTVYRKGYNDGVFTVEGRNLFAPISSTGAPASAESDAEDTDDSDNSSNSTETEAPEERGEDSTEEIDATSHTTYTLVSLSTGEVIVPEIISVNKSGRKVKMRLDVSALEVGDYMLTAMDASGLKTTGEKNLITVKESEGMSFDVSLGYSLPFPLYGGTYPEYMESKIYPYNAYAKLALIFLKRKTGHFGVGLNAHANHIKYENSAYTIKGNTIDTYLNAIYKMPIHFSSKNKKKRERHIATLEIHGGVGVLLFNDFQFTFANNKKSLAFNSFGISVQCGADIQFFLGRNFFLEMGLDYINAFMPDSAFGEVIPQAGIGWHL